MGRLSVVLAALAIMLLGFVATVAMLGDEDRIRQLLTLHAERQLGRQLQIDGAVSIQYFPRLRIEARDVRLSGSRAFNGPDLLESEVLSAEIRLLPLLMGRVETSEFSLSQARLNLLVDEQGDHSFAGLLHHRQRTGAPGIVADGPLRLENLELNIGSLGLEPAQRIVVERVEMDRLSFDRALQLSFLGEIGSPPLIEEASLRGVVFMPAASGDFRIADMLLTGRNAGAVLPFELTGTLHFSAHPPLSVSLDSGRLGFGGQELSLEGAYLSRVRPFFQLEVVGQALDAEALQAVIAQPEDGDWLSSLAAWTAIHDFSAAIRVDALQAGEWAPAHVDLVLVAADGMATLDRARVMLPGAVAELEGDLLVEPQAAVVTARARVEIDDLQALLAATALPLRADGAGLLLVETADSSDSRAPVRGELRLLDGRLEPLAALRRELGLPGETAFSELEAEFLVHADRIEFLALRIHGQNIRLDLDGLIVGPGQVLAGQAAVRGGEADGAIQRIAGSLGRPEFRQMPSQ